jgi:hypothetical protein
MEAKKRNGLIVGAVLGVGLVVAIGLAASALSTANGNADDEIFARVAAIKATPEGLGQMTDDPLLQQSSSFWGQYAMIDFEDNVEDAFLSEARVALAFEKGVANMSGKDLWQTINLFQKRILGFDELDTGMLALRAGVSQKEYTPPVIAVPVEFKAAYQECLTELTERYSENGNGLLTSLESAFDFMRPECDDLQSMASNFSSYAQ